MVPEVKKFLLCFFKNLGPQYIYSTDEKPIYSINDHVRKLVVALALEVVHH
jgi:hypothetical protein